MSATSVNGGGEAEFTVLRSCVPWTTSDMMRLSEALPGNKVARGGPELTIMAIRHEHSRERLRSILKDREFCVEHVGRANLPIEVSHDED